MPQIQTQKYSLKITFRGRCYATVLLPEENETEALLKATFIKILFEEQKGWPQGAWAFDLTKPNTIASWRL